MTRKRKILILASNPGDLARLRLDVEVREISEGLRRSRHREAFEIVQQWAVGPREMRRALLDVEPDVVHFCGHGDEDGLLVEGDSGDFIIMPNDALADLFSFFADKIECVVLNACWSQAQAEVIAEHIAYVVGMSKPVNDRAGIEFAVGFYDGLGAGEDYEAAFRLGKNAVHGFNLPDHEVPQLIVNKAAARTLRERREETQVKTETSAEAANGGKSLDKRWLIGVLLAIVPAGIAAFEYIRSEFFKPSALKYLSIAEPLQLPDTLYLAQATVYRDSFMQVKLTGDSSKRATADLSFSLTAGDAQTQTRKLPVMNDFKGGKSIKTPWPALDSLARLIDRPTDARAELKLEISSFEDDAVEVVDFKSDSMVLVPRNYLDLSEARHVWAFVTSEIALFAKVAREIEAALDSLYDSEDGRFFGVNFIKAVAVWQWLQAQDLNQKPIGRGAQYLQYPPETLAAKAGTGNDLAVLFATLLEAMDVDVDFAVVGGRDILIYFETDIQDKSHPLYPQSDDDPLATIGPLDKVWLPVNLNAFHETFYEAWFVSRLFNKRHEIVAAVAQSTNQVWIDELLEPNLNSISVSQMKQNVEVEIADWRRSLAQ